MFTGGKSLNSPGSNQFDVTVFDPHGIVITGFDVNGENTRNGPVGSAFEIDVYITAPGGTYVGNETNAAQWLLASHGAGSSNTLGNQAMLLDPLATNAAGVNLTNLAAGRVGL